MNEIELAAKSVNSVPMCPADQSINSLDETSEDFTLSESFANQLSVGGTQEKGDTISS